MKKIICFVAFVIMLGISFCFAASNFTSEGAFYAVAGGVYEATSATGVSKWISLVDFSGEGAVEDSVSEGVDYKLSNACTYDDSLEYNSLLQANSTPVFVWAMFDENTDEIKTIIPLEGGIASGDTEGYLGGYTILDASNTVVDNGSVGEYKVVTSKVMTVTPIKDEDELVEGYAIKISEGLEDGDELPAGSLIAYNPTEQVRKAEYIFIPRQAESSEWLFGLVETYDEARISYITINGERYELSENSPITDLEEGNVVAYTIFDEKVSIQKIITTSDIDNAMIISAETESDFMVFVGETDPIFDLEEDSDDVKKYKNYKVVYIEVGLEDDNETLVFESAEEDGKGLIAIDNSEGVRILIDEEKCYILEFVGLRLDEKTSNGKLVDDDEGGDDEGGDEPIDPPVTHLFTSEGAFYAVAGGVYEATSATGVSKWISLVDFSGEGAVEDSVSEGVDYKLSNACTYDDSLEYNSLLQANSTPVFVWAMFDENTDEIKTIIPLEGGIASGDTAGYLGGYTIADVSNTTVNNGSVGEYKVVSSKVMMVTPITENEEIIGYAVSISNGLEDGDRLPAGSMLAYNPNKTIKKAEYVFVSNQAVSLDWLFGLVDTYDKASGRGISYVTINGERYELNEDTPITDFEVDDVVAYTLYNEKVCIQRIITTSDIDNAMIISDETENDVIVFTENDDPMFDLDEDSDDVKKYKNYKVVNIEVGLENDNETLVFESAEESDEKGLLAINNSEGVRILINEEKGYILEFDGLELDERTSNGKLVDNQGDDVTTGDDEPASSGEKPTSSGEKPEGSGEVPTSSGEKPEGSGEAPTTSGEKPESSGEIPTTSDDEKPSSGGSSSHGRSGGSSTSKTYKLSVKCGEGGKISPDSIKIDKNGEQVFSITANDGYEIQDVLVDGKSVGKVSSYTFKNVTSTHTIEAKFTKVEISTSAQSNEWSNPFNDVNSSDWFYANVKYALEKGIFKGTTDTTFEPNKYLTRGMLVTVLYRFANASETEKATFSDVDENEYYSEPIAWAAKNGFVNGVGEGKFEPNASITRQDLATIIYRFLKANGEGFEGSWMFLLNYADKDDIAEYAYEPICFLTMNKVLNGKDSNNIDPNGLATRAETAAIIQRIDK